MEVLILVVLIAVIAYLGLFKPVVQLADSVNDLASMGRREARELNNSHKMAVVKRSSEESLSSAEVSAYKKRLETLNSLDI